MNGDSKDNKKRMGILAVIILLVAVVALLLFRYYSLQSQASKIDFAMGTVISAQLYGGQAETLTGEIIDDILMLDEQVLSWRSQDSELAILDRELNSGCEAEISAEMYEYLKDSLALCQDSSGALDITIQDMIDLWGIETDNPRVPTERELQACCENADYASLSLYEKDDRYYIQSEEAGKRLNLGALGKGIAADEVRTKLDEYTESSGLRAAVVSIGGTILTYGTKPDHKAWQVGIRDPRGAQDSMIGTLSLSGTHVISTSGDYEKYFEQDGIRYHHILDPKTGYPADSGLISVTVVCDEGIYSDGLSTACFVLGMENSLKLLEAYHAEAVFITKDRNVYTTDGLKDVFTLTDSDYRYMVD